MHQPHSGGNMAEKETMATHALPKQAIDPEIKMEEEDSAGPEVGEGIQGTALPETGKIKEFLSRETSQSVKQEPEEGPSRNEDVQFQEFLKTLQAPQLGEESPLPELRQRNNPITSLVSEGALDTSKWSRELWVSPTQPHPVEEDQQEQNSHLDATQDGNEASGVLPGDAIRTEVQRLQFRLFCYRESEGPRKTYLQLQELCCQWLKPERHTKEQILDQLILEQFLAILPPEMQDWLLQQDPETCNQAVTLAEHFLLRQQETKGWEQQIEETPLRRKKVSDEEQRALDEKRRTKDAERKRLARSSETAEQRALRLQKKREYMQSIRFNETEEEREERLQQAREHMRDIRSKETRKQREERLGLTREQMRNVHSNMADEKCCVESPSKRTRTVGQDTQQGFCNLSWITGMSEKEFVNPPKAGETLPSTVNTQRFAEIKQEDGGSVILLGDRWLNKNKEQKPELESPEEKEPPRTSLETAEANSVLWGGEADENQGMVERQNGNVSEEEGEQFVLSQTAHERVGEGTVHQDENRKKYEKHGEIFEQSLRLLTYKSIHAEKLYKCWHCGRSFCSSSDLMTHERTHVGEKLYICSLCGESERTHRGQKPHKCSHCGSTFD